MIVGKATDVAKSDSKRGFQLVIPHNPKGLTVYYSVVEPTDKWDWHCHPTSYEICILLSGEMEHHFKDGTIIQKNKGDMIYLEAGTYSKTIVRQKSEAVIFRQNNERIVSLNGCPVFLQSKNRPLKRFLV